MHRHNPLFLCILFGAFLFSLSSSPYSRANKLQSFTDSSLNVREPHVAYPQLLKHFHFTHLTSAITTENTPSHLSSVPVRGGEQLLMMKRLLLNFSYIGTNYKGLQRTIPYQPLVQRAPDLETIQGILEFGLQKIFQVKPQPVNVIISSRTDAGVHALDSTVHLDVDEKWFKKVPYSPEKVCQSLNLFLEKNECDIRVNRVVQVPNDFHCRRVFSRIYEFRVAVLNTDPHQLPSNLRLSCATDIRDLNRCAIVVQPFNFPVVRDACRLFLGKWDFSTFMKTSGEHITPARRIKTCLRVSVSPEVIPPQDFDELNETINAKPYDIYTFTIEGSGFLRRQVRRMVGALVGVGRGTIGPKDIVWMLENPSERNWPKNVSALGPSGLFLKQINYTNLEILRGYYS